MVTINPSSAPEAVMAFMSDNRSLIDDRIAHYIGDDDDALTRAMRYAALGPGKRLRPVMTVAACLAAGGERDACMPAAAAVEMLHAYTLVHDDLPAMDDDDMRRGRPTVHIEFGEAMAILVGDALLTAAFGALADLGAHAGAAVAVLARRAGARELIGGQVMDIALAESSGQASFEDLEELHWRKTGALFAAATELGAIAAGADAEVRANLARYGMNIGIAFQYADDRDDQEHVHHAERARQRMVALTDEARRIADGFGPVGRPLQHIASWIGGVA